METGPRKGKLAFGMFLKVASGSGVGIFCYLRIFTSGINFSFDGATVFFTD
jgi:hypothetical protein